jgi:hypothetical protein
MPDDEQEREERARRLHDEIDALESGREPTGPPASPREFIDRQMRKQEEDPDDAEQRSETEHD